MYFQVYCSEDSKCFLNVVGQHSVRECEDVIKALETAREIGDEGNNCVTIYGTTGSVIMEATV